MVEDIFKQHLEQLEDFIGTLPALAANEALHHFDGSFTDKGFTDEETELWKPVVDRKTGAVKERPLVQTGAMRRATRAETDASSATIYNDIPYAPYHNDGGSKEGRPPKRQFIGPSKQLNEKIIKIIENGIDAIIQ